MARKFQHRAPAQSANQAPASYGRISPGGTVQGLYASLAPDERHVVVDAIGLKWCQRIGHRHKVPVLRDAKDLAQDWGGVDEWIVSTDDRTALGDLFDPLASGLVERGRELLGENADEPTVEHLAAMSEALAAERSSAEARLLLAIVVEFEFTAGPQARALAVADQRFALPLSAEPVGAEPVEAEPVEAEPTDAEPTDDEGMKD